MKVAERLARNDLPHLSSNMLDLIFGVVVFQKCIKCFPCFSFLPIHYGETYSSTVASIPFFRSIFTASSGSIFFMSLLFFKNKVQSKFNIKKNKMGISLNYLKTYGRIEEGENVEYVVVKKKVEPIVQNLFSVEAKLSD